VPEATALDLMPECRMLLGVALLLQRAPGVMRSRDFAPAARRWMQAAVAMQELPPEPAEGRRFLEVQTVERPPRLGEIQKPEPPFSGDGLSLTALPPKEGEQGVGASLPLAGTDSQSQPPAAAASGGVIEAERGHGPLPEVPVTSLVPDEVESGVVGAIPTQPELVTVAPPGSIFPAAETEKFPEEKPLVEMVETQYGGVFYLLNLALALGLYGDFTTPASPGISLSPWDFLALVGRVIIGPKMEADPLWELLRRLAGRQPDQPPGWGFESPDGTPFDIWLQQIILQVHASLLPAFGLENPAELGPLLCAHPARILISSARLDVTFSLAEHPLVIRQSGLDRDPGWIPAAGHYVVYHYD
jgi:hypothetical protein